MPHTTTKRKRIKRPDFRPNGKRRLKAQQAKAEKDRLARVAERESRGKLLAPPKHEKLPPVEADVGGHKHVPKGQILRRESSSRDASRYRSLHKLLRQIVALEEKQNSGVTLNEAQLAKLERFDSVAAELEELQQSLEQESEEESEDEDEEASAEESEGEDGKKESKGKATRKA